MFDEIAPKNPNEPEDIFAGAVPEPAGPLNLKSALANKKLKPLEEGQLDENFNAPSPMPKNPSMPEIEITPPLLSKKSVFIVVGVILIIGLGIGTAWGIFNASKKTAPKNTAVVNLPINTLVNEPVVVPEVPVIVETATTTIPTADTDGDGLTDEEETKYGTDPQKKDTDADLLTDYEEIMIWKTDPLNPNTDGDAYGDGVEVQNGFNPLGSGRLLELPAQ